MGSMLGAGVGIEEDGRRARKPDELLKESRERRMADVPWMRLGGAKGGLKAG